MNSLPKHWEAAPLAEVAEVRLGRQRSPKNADGPEQRPYLRAANVTWDGLDLADVKTMSFSARERETHRLKGGDLLLAEASGSASEVGKPAVWRDELPECYFQNTLIRVRPTIHSPDFLRYHLLFDALSGRFVHNSRGVGIHHLGAQSLSSHVVVIPPREEQWRIVAALDEQLSRVASTEESLEAIRAKLAAYRAAVLRAACEGRLVPTEAELAQAEERAYENALVAWERVRHEKRRADPQQASRRGISRRPLRSASACLHGLPNGWTTARIDDLCWLDTGFAFKSGDFSSEGVRLLRGENIEPRRLRWENTEHLPREMAQAFADLEVECGDIILAMDRPIVSAGLKLARVAAADLPAILVQRVARLRFVDKSHREYVYLALQQREFIKQLGLATTGTQVPHITAESIREYTFALPPIAEQRRIVAEVERRLSVVERLEASVNANLARAKRLRQAILKRAFEGRLVPQDPNEEPASALLERIRKEREARGAKAGPKPTRARRGQKP